MKNSTGMWVVFFLVLGVLVALIFVAERSPDNKFPNGEEPSSTSAVKFAQERFSSEPGIIAFTVDWCSHCKKLKGESKNFPPELQNKIAFVDAEKRNVAGISQYPTIYIFNGMDALERYQSDNRTPEALKAALRSTGK